MAWSTPAAFRRVPDLFPTAVAAIVAVVASGGVALVNHRLGLDAATTRYIASLEGLVKARDARIADLELQLADLQRDYRVLKRRLDEFERDK